MNSPTQKVIVTLTQDQLQLLKSFGLIIDNGEKYYHDPNFYKLIKGNTFEVVKKDDLPTWVKEVINPYNL